MRYTRTAITKLTKWYKNVLIKCAILNASVFLGATLNPVEVNALEVLVSDWNELKANVEAGNSVKLDSIITANAVDAIYSKNTVPEAINLNSKTLDVQVNQEYESYGSAHNSLFYFEGNAEGKKTLITGGTIQNAINSTLCWYVFGSELEITSMNFLNNYVTGEYSNRYGQGGALKLSSANKVTISDSVFTGNTVHDASNQSYGGAIESYANNLIISDSTFTYNGIKDYNSTPQTTTQDGGAMMIASENSTLDTVTFTSNKSTNSGGAIAYIPVYDINSTIKNTSFEANETVNKGGAIYAERSEITDSANIGLTVENTNFTSNKATGANSKGGAIYASSDVNGLTITDSSFRNNAAKEGGAIYSESYLTTTIHANAEDVVFENNNSTGTAGGTGNGIYLNGALNAQASEGKTLTINDTIKFADSSSMLNINTDFTNNYSGTVVLDKALDGGYGINLGGGATGNAGTLKLGQEAANQTLNFLGAYGAALDLRNDHAGDVLTINELSANRVSTTNLNLDFDANSGISDKLVINGLESGVDSAKFNLNAINVTADGTAGSGTFMESAVSDDITLSQTPQLTTVTSGGYKYTFTLDDNNFGVFNVIRGTSIEASSLAEAIGLSVIDAYSMFSQETVTQTLGTLTGDNRNFTIFGNNNDIIASGSVAGLTVNSGQTLTLDKISNFSGFSNTGNGGALNTSGTATIKDSSFTNNTGNFGGAIFSNGETNVIAEALDVVLNGNTGTISGGAIGNNSNGILSINAKGADVTFSNNTASKEVGGAITNYNNIDINADGGNVNFTSNIATKSGGAIYSNKGNITVNANGGAVNFSGNKASQNSGGAIYNPASGSLELNTISTDADSKITFENNSAVYGGAIYNSKILDINAINNDVIFKNNTATWYGGAIYNAGTATLNALGGNILFENNTANRGGAIYNATNAVLTLNADGGNITFNNNSGTYGTTVYNGGTLNLMAKGGNNITFSSDSTSKGIVVVHKDAFMNIGSQANPEYYNGNVNFGDLIWDAWTDGGEKVGGTINIYSGNADFEKGFYVKNFNNYGGNVFIKDDITATDGTIINNANITFTSGSEENYGISVSSDIIGDGTLTFDDGASFGNDVEQNHKKLNQKSINITENGSLSIKARDLTVDEDIVNDGDFNVGAGVLTKAISGKGTTSILPYYDFEHVDASENTVSIYNNIDQNITVVLGAILEVNDGVEKLGAIANSDTVDFRTDFDVVNSIKGDGSAVNINNGAQVTVNNEIDASNMNVNDGTIVLNTLTNYLEPSDGTTNHLTLALGNNGVLDMRDTNKTINEITMMYFKSDNSTLHFDTDFANNLTDTIKASNGYNSEFKNLNLGSINVKSHFDGDVGTTKNIDIFTGLTSPYDYGDMTVVGVAASTLDNYTYVFTPTNDIDVITVTKHDFISLSDAIADTVSLGLTTYTFDQDLTMEKSLDSLAGDGRNFGIFGNGHTVQGNAYQGATVSNGQTLNLDSVTFDGFDGAITNQGTVNLNASTNDVVFSSNNGAINNTGTVNMAATKGNNIIFAAAEESANNNIYNTGTLNLNKGNVQILSAITDSDTPLGTTNIGTATTTVTVIANAITQNALNIQNGSSLAINADNLKITDAINNLGSITLGNGTLTSAIGGTDGTTVINGDVTLANNLTNQNIEITNGSLIANSTTDYIGNTNNLTIKNDGILDLSSEDKSINTVVVNNFTVDSSATNASGIKFDVNFADANLSDKVSVAGKATGNLNVQAINAKGDFDGGIDATKTITLIEGSDISGLSLVADSIRTATSQYSYDFTTSNEAGKLVVTKAEGMTLPEAIGQEGYNHNVTAYTLLNDYTTDTSLGNLAGDNRNFTIYGNTKDIIASGSVASGSVEGIGIYEGQTLTIDKVGDISDPNSKGFSGFYSGDLYSVIDNWHGGTINISDSVFSDNSDDSHYLYSATVYNIGEANITNSIFRDNGTAISNTARISSDESSVEDLGVANITDTNFINNGSDYGAIVNYGTMSIVAQDKDVLFSENNATTAGGAIYNSNENLPLAGLGVLNLNAKNGNKITFSAATDTANNNIYNDATINLNEGNIEILSAITDAAAPTGTTNIGTTTTTATVVANAITQKALNINNGSSLAINAGNLKITDTISNSGTITLGDGTLTSAINGTNGTTVINGNVTLANNLTNQNIEITNGSLIANSTTDYIGSTNNLTIKNNGILDLSSDDKTINTVAVNDFTVDGSATANSGIKFDVNFDGANVSSDKVSVAGTATGNLNIQSVNVKGDFDGDIDSTKTFNLVEGSNISGLNLISDSIRTVTGQYAYDFTAGANDGELLVTKTNGMTLQEAIGQKGVDYNATSYSLTKDYTVDTTLGYLAGTNRNFTIYGNKNDIIANGNNIYGILLDEGQTLTIDKVGNISDPNSKGFSGFYSGDFYSVIDNWRGGTINISDSVFSDNSPNLYGATVYNIGEVNITNSIFRDNGVAISNGALINSINPEAQFVEDLGVANITDTDFINNESDYGAIINSGTMSIVAQDKDVLFSGNNNRTTAGGAIYNSNENLPLAGLGVLNLNAKNGNKITFAATTDTANNNIYNDATINLNEGNIEILSAITDNTTPSGTTNIGTKDTTATVVANAITQKALNINNGSSLAIDADGLKIADTINNLGSIALGDGTLTSAIGGTDGTTLINGDVVANSAITQAITVNADKSLTTNAGNIGGAITNNGIVNLNSGTLAQTITGGNIYILASQEVTSDLSKLAGNFENQGTLNLQGGLTSDIKGNGTTVLQNDISLTENRMITGTLNLNNQTIDMGNESPVYNTMTVGNLIGNGNLQIDVDLTNNSGKATANDKIYITNGSSNSGTLNLNVINIENELATSDSIYSNYIDYVTGNNSNITYQLSGSENGQIIAVTTDHKYTFTKGNDGSLNVLAQDYTGGLSDYITGEITANNFSINKDITLNDNEDIGITQGTDTTKNILINNGSTLTGFDGTAKYNNGITVADGYTLNLTGSENASMENFVTALEVNNGGILNITDMAFANNTTDIANSGTLNLTGNNSFETGITGNGSTNIISGITTNNGIITQNTVSITDVATLNTNANNLIANSPINNDGTIEFTGGSVQSDITGNGKLSILDNVTNDKTITQTITNIATGKTLTNDGTLNTSVQLASNQTINGQGTLNLTGNSTNEGSIIQNLITIADTADLTTSADTINANINNAGNLKLTDGLNTNTISGLGTTKISGAVENTTGMISQEIIIESGSLTTSADALGGYITNLVDDGLILNGGTLAQNISGEGSVNITGNVTSNAVISQEVNIQSGSLTTSANNLASTVTNMIDGGLVLNGGILNQTISGNGSTIITGDVLWGTNAGLNDVTIVQNASLDIGTNQVILGDTDIKGTLKMTITDMAKDSSDYTGGKLIVNDLNLDYTSKLSMTIASGLLTERYSSSGELDLIQVNGNFTGKFEEILSNNRYEVIQTENGKFNIFYVASPTDIVNEGGGNINNSQTAEAWDKVPTTGNPTTDAMQAHLNELSQHDSNGYVKALNNLAPTDSQAVARTTIGVNNLIGRQIERRQEDQGMSSGDIFQKVGIWMEGLANYSKQDSSSSHAGFTGKTGGFSLGLDGKINDNITLGFGYAYNKTDIDTLDRDIDVNGHTLFLYSKYQPEKWYVRGMAHYGFANYKEKSDVNGINNSADYDVQNIGLSAYLGYDLPNGITPEGGLRFTHVNPDNYIDHVGQNVSIDNNNILTLVVGAKYTKTFTNENGIHWTPKARAALTYDIITDNNNANVDIAGINYEVNGEKIDRLELELGLGLEADINDWNFSVGYDLGIRDDYISHTGMFKARYNF